MRFSLLALLALAAVAPARAQVSFVPMVGYDFDYEAAQIGLGFELGITPGILPAAISLRPSVEYVFAGEGVDVIRGNADLIGRFSVVGVPFAPYAKAGVAAEFGSPDSGDSNTEFGLNLGVGAEVTRFLVEGTLGIGNISSGRIAVGYRF